MLQEHEDDCYTLHEYIDLIAKFRESEPDKELWYRGQSDSEWKLVPSLWRYGIADTGETLCATYTTGKRHTTISPNEEYMLNLFIDTLRSEKLDCPSSYIHQMTLAQHYGLPTNLLDWSSDPLVALYFAASGVAERALNSEDEPMSERFFSIWILDPQMVNQKSEISTKIIDPSNQADHKRLEDAMSQPLGYTYCFRGLKEDRRVVRQSGNFTYSSSIFQAPLDYADIYQNCLKRINFPYSTAEEIVHLLKVLDLTEESIYFGHSKKDAIAAKVKKSVLSNFNITAPKWLETQKKLKENR